MRSSPLDLAVGILLVVFGILLVVNRVGLGPLLPYAGIALVILGALMLARALPGGILLAVLALVAGAILVGGFWSIPRAVGDWLWMVNLALGVLLLVFGIKRLAGHAAQPA